MQKKKVMRGFFWSIFLFCALIVITTSILNLWGIKQLGMDSTLGNIVAIIIAGLYIAAYFIVPKYVHPKAAMPAVPMQNVPLAVPAQMTIVRDSSVAGAVVPYIIFLNGQQVCSLNNGCSATITLTMRHNVLMTNAVGSSKTRYEFDAADGAQGEIRVKGGVFLSKTMRWL